MKTEIIKNQPFEVCMERSYVNCLYQGMRIGVENVANVWKNTWPFFLFCLFLPFPFSLLLPAAVAALLPKWPEMGLVPKLSLREQGTALQKVFCRFLVYGGMYAGIAAVLLGALFALVYAGLPVWAMALFIVVSILLLLPLEWVKLDLLYSDNKVGQCVAGYKTGLKNYGKLFSFYLLVMLIVLVIMCIAAMPLVVCSLVIREASIAESIGDAVYIPGYFWFLVFLAYVILPAVLYYVHVLVAHAEYLLWGSITACEKQKESVEEIPA